MMDSKDEITGPVNLGNPGEFTILELAQRIIEKTNTISKIQYCPLPADDPLQRKPVIEKAKELLSWEPQVSLDQGLDATIPYFKRQLAAMA